METIETLQQELLKVENDISNKEIANETYELMTLLNRRVALGKKIQRLKWNNLSDVLKEKERYSDFNTTKAYFEKYPDDVSNKYKYKKEYINFLREAKVLATDENPAGILCKVLIFVLNSVEYMNINESSCVKSIIEQLKLCAPIEANELINIYQKIYSIPFEL